MEGDKPSGYDMVFTPSGGGLRGRIVLKHYFPSPVIPRQERGTKGGEVDILPFSPPPL
jgi:hypothetical protein